MGQPVKLSDQLIIDARRIAALSERSIAGQVEFWASLGRAIEPLIDGSRVWALRQSGTARPLSECVAAIDTDEGRERLRAYLADTPFPHFEAAPDEPSVLIRIEKDGTRTRGRFVGREFQPIECPTLTSSTLGQS